MPKAIIPIALNNTGGELFTPARFFLIAAFGIPTIVGVLNVSADV